MCPDPRVQNDLIRHVELATQRGVNCSALVGATLTRRKKRFLVHGYSDELFVFELTPKQAEILEVQDNMLVRVFGHPRDPSGSVPASLFLNHFEVHHADGLDRYLPITGQYSFETSWNYPVACVLRLDFELPDGRWAYSWHPPAHELPPAGQFEFSFSPFCHENDSLSKTFAGPIVFFIKVFARIKPGKPEDLQPVSDTSAVLVNIA